MVSDVGVVLVMIVERVGILGGVVSNEECLKFILDVLV